MTEAVMQTSDFMDELTRTRGRPSRETSDQLAREAQFFAGKPVEGIAAQSATTINHEPKRFRWWWESIIDWMLANPQKSLSDCARELDRTPAYIYQLTQSDIFKERYRQRVAEKNELLNGQLVQRVAGAAITATQLIQDKLDVDSRRAPESRTIDLETLSEVNDKLLKSLGYGGKNAAAPVNVNVTQQVIDTGAKPELLRAAGARIIEHGAAVAMAPAEPPSAESLFPPEQDQALVDDLALFMGEPLNLIGPDIDPELAEREASDV